MALKRTGTEHAIEQLPRTLQQLLVFERFNLHKPERFQNAMQAGTFDIRFLPSNCDAIQLPCFWVQRKHLYVYGTQVNSANEFSLFEGDDPHERILFPVHPTSLEHYKGFLTRVHASDASLQGVCIWAVPTSSARTFLAWPDKAPEKALFIKTSLQSKIFGDRRLYLRKVGTSVGLSTLMCESRARLPPEIDFFPECLGFTPRELQDSGVVIRSIPPQIKAGEVQVAPLFSLMGGAHEHRPLFLTIIEETGMEPYDLLDQVICAPFARLWLDLAIRLGLVLEAHGQDLLLALSPDLVPLRQFYYRDFEGLQVDWELRQSRKLLAPQSLPHAWAWYDTYASWGFSHAQMVSYKFSTSLFNYLHYVLKELNTSLSEWRAAGLISRFNVKEDDVTMLFSTHMMSAIDEMFGVRVIPKYNIHYSLNRFVRLLMQIRLDLMRESKSRAPNASSPVR